MEGGAQVKYNDENKGWWHNIQVIIMHGHHQQLITGKMLEQKVGMLV